MPRFVFSTVKLMASWNQCSLLQYYHNWSLPSMKRLLETACFLCLLSSFKLLCWTPASWSAADQASWSGMSFWLILIKTWWLRMLFKWTHVSPNVFSFWGLCRLFILLSQFLTSWWCVTPTLMGSCYSWQSHFYVCSTLYLDICVAFLARSSIVLKKLSLLPLLFCPSEHVFSTELTFHVYKHVKKSPAGSGQSI